MGGSIHIGKCALIVFLHLCFDASCDQLVNHEAWGTIVKCFLTRLTQTKQSRSSQSTPTCLSWTATRLLVFAHEPLRSKATIFKGTGKSRSLDLVNCVRACSPTLTQPSRNQRHNLLSSLIFAHHGYSLTSLSPRSSVLSVCRLKAWLWPLHQHGCHQSEFHFFHMAMPTDQLCNNIAKRAVTKICLIIFVTCQTRRVISELMQPVCPGGFRRSFCKMIASRHSW